MYFVYFLRSIKNPDMPYTGITNNIKRRLDEHNRGDDVNSYTYIHKPWELEAHVLADNKNTAEIVERFFKNRSGREKFENYAAQNPNSNNPINDYFSSLKIGKGFGKRARGTRFKVIENDGVPLFAMA